MSTLLRTLLQEVLYWIDPFFRSSVQRKRRGPNDKIGSGEKIAAIIQHADGSKKAVRRKR